MRIIAFQHTFDGVTIGVSARHDVCRYLAFPLWKFYYWGLRRKFIWWEPHPQHNDIEIKIDDDGKVGLIVIHRLGYRDSNGIQVGGPWSQVADLFSTTGKSFIDEYNGIIYHCVTDKDEVDKIVLSRSLIVRDE